MKPQCRGGSSKPTEPFALISVSLQFFFFVYDVLPCVAFEQFTREKCWTKESKLSQHSEPAVCSAGNIWLALNVDLHRKTLSLSSLSAAFS